MKMHPRKEKPNHSRTKAPRRAKQFTAHSSGRSPTPESPASSIRHFLRPHSIKDSAPSIAMKSSANTNALAELTTHGTRDYLIRAATQLFSRQGFAKTSVKEISDLAGVNVSLVSYYFGGKQELYEACIRQFGESRLASVQKILQPAKTADEFRFRLQMYLEEIFAVSSTCPDVLQIIHQECDLGASQAQEVFQATFVEAFNILVRFMTHAQSQRILRPELDPLFSSGFLFGSVMHVLRSRNMGKRFWDQNIEDPEIHTKLIETYLSIFLQGARLENSATPQALQPSKDQSSSQLRNLGPLPARTKMSPRKPRSNPRKTKRPALR